MESLAVRGAALGDGAASRFQTRAGLAGERRHAEEHEEIALEAVRQRHLRIFGQGALETVSGVEPEPQVLRHRRIEIADRRFARGGGLESAYIQHLVSPSDEIGQRCRHAALALPTLPPPRCRAHPSIRIDARMAESQGRDSIASQPSGQVVQRRVGAGRGARGAESDRAQSIIGMNQGTARESADRMSKCAFDQFVPRSWRDAASDPSRMDGARCGPSRQTTQMRPVGEA